MKGTAEADRWPSDEEFATAWSNNPLYENVTRPRLRMLLEAMEAGLRNEFAETKSVPKDLTIEHIMPQGWREHWDQPLQLTAEVRDRSVHTIGNLTLLNEKFNAHQSNRRWLNTGDPNKGKREALDRHSVLYLNKGLVQFEEWNEAHMAERSKELLSVALKVWPRPAGQS